MPKTAQIIGARARSCVSLSLYDSHRMLRTLLLILGFALALGLRVLVPLRSVAVGACWFGGGCVLARLGCGVSAPFFEQTS